MQKVDIKAKHGVILSCNVDTSASHAILAPSELADFDERMVGLRYGGVEPVAFVMDCSSTQRLGEVWNWVCAEMRQ